jgi:hypothetical protein
MQNYKKEQFLPAEIGKSGQGGVLIFTDTTLRDQLKGEKLYPIPTGPSLTDLKNIGAKGSPFILPPLASRRLCTKY